MSSYLLTGQPVFSRFVDDAFGFALTWNYWFNDAVSTASDLVALQLILQYWTDNFPGWALSLIFWFVLIVVNIVSVRAYGEVKKHSNPVQIVSP
jgi:AAT family amino acid transporter